jgi:CHAT domain-containing protein
MGRSLLALGRPEEAVRRLELAESLFAATSNSLGRIGALLDLGRAWQSHGDDARAGVCLERALELSRQRQTLIGEAMAQAAVARLEASRGRLAAAEQAVAEALGIVETVRLKVASQRLRISFIASRRQWYELQMDILMRRHELEPGGAFLEEALAVSERARARGLLDLLAEGRIDVRRGIAPELKQKEDDLAAQLAFLQTQLLDDLSGRGNGPSRVAALEGDLARVEELREQLEWEIRREHPRYAAVRHPLPLSATQVRALLDDQTVLLEYSVGQDGSWLFAVTADEMAGWRLPPVAELTALVEEVRHAVRKPGVLSHSRYVRAARRLHEILIAPAAELLRDKPHLVVSPDGPLLLLPFETLLTGPPPEEGDRLWGKLPYLIRERSIAYAPSASVLAELGIARGAASSSGGKLFVAYADPDYPSPQGAVAADAPAAGPATHALQLAGLSRPSPLPASRHEVMEIAGLYAPQDVAVYVDTDVTEENVKENPVLRTARRIHFAVHGFLNEQQPELSGLMLAQRQGSKEDGLLQVFEIFNLELDAADLVVFSACDTALGRHLNGEGLLGVTRALFYAGAPSVVVSLWQVSDTSTADLMIRFYHHLEGMGDKAEALRRSKLALIEGGETDHPYYWAPFILIGQSDEGR